MKININKDRVYTSFQNIKVGDAFLCPYSSKLFIKIVMLDAHTAAVNLHTGEYVHRREFEDGVAVCVVDARVKVWPRTGAEV